MAQAGRVVAMDDAWEPYRLVDADGVVVESVAAYLRDLQAAGRSAATARSCALDLLRWFRFLWAVEIGWDRATRVEVRDFCRWLQIAGKPVRPHWRRRDEPAATGARPGGGPGRGAKSFAQVKGGVTRCIPRWPAVSSDNAAGQRGGA